MSVDIREKKILHVLGTLNPSGAETMLASATGKWQGYQSYILATNQELGPFATRLDESGYIIRHIWNKNILIKHRAIAAFIKKEGFDVVHVHTEKQRLFYIADAFWGGTSRIVSTIHNCFLFEGVLRIRRVITRWIGKLFGVKYVAISKAVADNELERFHNRCECIVNNWCDESRYKLINKNERKEARNALGISDDQFVIVMVGNCNGFKNHLMMIQAFDRFLNSTAADSVLFHIGKESEEYACEREYVGQHGLQNRVVFCGQQVPDTYYKACDLYMMCSTIEGFGISALEAMACGLPVLLSNQSGLADFKCIQSRNVNHTELTIEDVAEAIDTQYKCFERNHWQIDEEEAVQAHQIYGVEQGVKEYLDVYE